MIIIADHLNETLTRIELLVATDNYSGSLDGIYDVIETFSLYRPVRIYIYFYIYICVHSCMWFL